MSRIFTYLISSICLLLCSVQAISSQELNMKITINSDRISGTDKTVFSNLESALNQLVNGRKWTDNTFQTNEKIDCSLLITINSQNDNTYKAEIQVTSNRPVYNSLYSSPMFNFKDVNFEFEYQIGQNIEFIENNVLDNLTATIAYYVYIVLGMDFDSFSLGGGKPYFEKAMAIASSSQGFNDKGWTPFGDDKNRYSLALSLTEESTAAPFHSMWYNYHRKGLDEMAGNETRGRVEVEKTLTELEKIYQSRPSSPILLFWGDTKLSELLNIYTKASPEEKDKAYKTLVSVYPTRRHIIDKIKK